MREDHGTSEHEPVPAGTRRVTGDPLPRAGTWELVDHATCPADGTLHALPPVRPAPSCPRCAADVTWQLTHLAPSAAADHRGADPLP